MLLRYFLFPKGTHLMCDRNVEISYFDEGGKRNTCNNECPVVCKKVKAFMLSWLLAGIDPLFEQYICLVRL